MKTLIYIGAHRGNSLANYINSYDIIYAFEANPNFCTFLQQRFINNKNVKIINAAICEKHNTFVDFNISKNNGDSSSLLEANKSNELYDAILSKEKIKVPAVNLFNFCQENQISYIDTYVSDLQGYDLIVLKTLKPYIETGKIKSIQCEVEKDDKTSIYINKDVENTNKEKNFHLLLKDRYEKVASGSCWLENGRLEDVPDNWCEYDVKWELKSE
jgi:FkbM family methyltransferase